MKSSLTKKILQIRLNKIFMILSVFAFMFCSTASSEIIHESASLANTGGYIGWGIHEYQFIGSRFHLDKEMEVTAIGGHLASINERLIFGAIVRLNDGYDLPSGDPFWSFEVVAHTLFKPPTWSDDTRTPLSVTLQPGWYGLVFGAGEFNSSWSAQASMPYAGQYQYPGTSYFVWDGWFWYDADLSSEPPRFVVEGNEIKPPTEIHGAKFEDTNGNSVWDENEEALHWEFYLDLNGNGLMDLGEPNQSTDPNGFYHFIDLDPGTYKVSEVMKDGWIQTYPGGLGYHTITVDANEITKGIYFGNMPLKIADFEPDGDVDKDDLMNFISKWLSEIGDDNWDSIYDISTPPDGIIDLRDFSVLSQTWLYVTPE